MFARRDERETSVLAYSPTLLASGSMIINAAPMHTMNVPAFSRKLTSLLRVIMKNSVVNTPCMPVSV